MLPETSYADSEKSAPEEKSEIDSIALAAILVQDGHFDRARNMLKDVDPTREGIDRPRFYMLFGLVELKAQNNRAAVRLLKRSIESGQTDPSVQVFLAQGCFAIEDYKCAIAALDDADEAAAKLPGSYLIRSQSHVSLGQNGPALAALEIGLKRFPENYHLMRHKVMLLISLGLFQQALQDGALLIRSQQAGSEDYVALGEALRRGHQLSAAVKILEEARLRYSNDEQVLKQLARTYLEASLPLSASRILQDAARINPALTSEVAELYRRAGKPLLALRINSDVTDQRVKTKQRLGLLIELQRFEQAEALVPRLSRLGLLGDDQTRYAIAYTYYRTGAYDRAENFVAQIDDPVFFQKAVELRRAIEVCRKDSSACY